MGGNFSCTCGAYIGAGEIAKHLGWDDAYYCKQFECAIITAPFPGKSCETHKP